MIFSIIYFISSIVIITTINMSSVASTSGIISIQDSLKKMDFSPELYTFMLENREHWVNFGKKDSHTLRQALEDLMDKEKLSGESRVMLYFFHSVVKDNTRILRAMKTLPEEAKKMGWFDEVSKFIDKRLTKFVTHETADKFASVHLPSTNPGLDCMFGALLEKKPLSISDLSDSVDRVMKRNTFAQIKINQELQNFNKSAVQIFWNSTVNYKKSKEDRKKRNAVVEEDGFQEAYYDTSAADEYLLVNVDLKEVPTLSSTGYTKDEICLWFANLHGISMEEMTELPSIFSAEMSEASEKKRLEESELKKRAEEEAKKKSAEKLELTNEMGLIQIEIKKLREELTRAKKEDRSKLSDKIDMLEMDHKEKEDRMVALNIKDT